MSRLIRDDTNNKPRERNQPEMILPLDGSAVVALLKSCQGLIADHARKAFKVYLKKLDDALGVEAQRARSDKEARERMELQRDLRKNAQELERYFCGYLAEGFVKFKKGELNTQIGAHHDGELSLVDHDDLEETIAISSITQRADAYYAEPLWALNQRFAVLNGGEHVTENSNPAAPVQFCESLRKALKLVPMDGKAKHLAYQVYDDQLLRSMSVISEDVNQFLRGQGVLPNLKYTIPTGRVPASALQDNARVSEVLMSMPPPDGMPDASLPPEEYQASLLQAIRGLQNELVPEVVSQPEGADVVSAADMLSALQHMQASGENLISDASLQSQLTPIDLQQLLNQLHSQLQTEQKDGAVNKDDMQTIDLVGMLFEYMLNDENLPDSIKALLSYLHTPFLKIAFIDPGFFEQAEHPARVLLNSLAEAGASWVGNDGTAQYDMYNKIKYIVQRILNEFENDIKIITELLLEFSSYTKNIIRRQELMEKRATEKAQGEEKLREVKLRVNEEIRDRTEGHELPSAILLFLLQPWSDYLSFALLRYGEKSDRWLQALDIVDQVLWCIEPKDIPDLKARQLEIHDELVVAIEHGFDTIGYDQVKGKKLLDALSSLIKLAIQSKKADPAPAPMRDKLERIAAEKAGSGDLRNEQCSPEEEQMVESLKMIEFGTWFEFDSGKRLKVAWYNARTSHYMLVDQMGKRVDMMSGLVLARQMLSSKAKIISGSSKPFFERALENIFQKLNEKAEAAGKPGGESEPE